MKLRSRLLIVTAAYGFVSWCGIMGLFYLGLLVWQFKAAEHAYSFLGGLFGVFLAYTSALHLQAVGWKYFKAINEVAPGRTPIPRVEKFSKPRIRKARMRKRGMR